MTWNVLLMSIGGMAIYNLMMDRYGAAKAASGFFIVPGASALIAWALIDEHLRPIALIGLAASTLGVVLVWWRPRKLIEQRLITLATNAKHPALAPGVPGENLKTRTDYAERRLPAACLPRSVTISNVTFWPSSSVRSPARSTALMCTNTSFEPSARLDESKALLGIEELHGTCRHHGSPCVATPVNPPHAHRAADKASEFWGMSCEHPKSGA